MATGEECLVRGGVVYLGDEIVATDLFIEAVAVGKGVSDVAGRHRVDTGGLLLEVDGL